MPNSQTQRREFWQEHLRAWIKSGLSVTDYCRKHGLPPGTAKDWLTRKAKAKLLRDQAKSQTVPDPRDPPAEAEAKKLQGEDFLANQTILTEAHTTARYILTRINTLLRQEAKNRILVKDGVLILQELPAKARDAMNSWLDMLKKIQEVSSNVLPTPPLVFPPTAFGQDANRPTDLTGLGPVYDSLGRADAVDGDEQPGEAGPV